MAVKILGWGKWGHDVCKSLEALNPEIKWTGMSYAEGDFGLNHTLDPVVADYILSNMQPEVINGIIDPEEDYHIHVIHAADNFASGALTGLMRRLANMGRKTHLAVVLLPPRGSNDATVGRLLANVVGLRNFFDICVLLDATAPIFTDWDAEHMAFYVAGLCSLFLTFEQSACMIPLLEQLDGRFLTFAAVPVHEVLSECSLEPLWRSATSPMRSDVNRAQQISKMLAFSVASGPEKNLYQVFKRNIPGEKFIYVPFLRLHDWKYACNPLDLCHVQGEPGKKLRGIASLSKIVSFMEKVVSRRHQSFVAAFVSDVPSRSIIDPMRNYTNKYWPSGHEADQYETYDPEVADWFKSRGLYTYVALQHKYLVKSARDFLKEKIEAQEKRS